MCANSADQERERTAYDEQRGSALIALDPAGGVRTWNRDAERLFAYQVEEIIGQPIAQLFLPLDAATGVPEQHRQHAQSHGHSTGTYWLLRRDGSRFWAQISMIARGTPQDRLHGFSLLILDMTEQYEMEVALRASEQRYRTLIENFPNGLITTLDRDLQITFVGGRDLERYHQPAAFYLGKHLSEVLPPETALVVEPHLHAALAAQSRWYEAPFGDRSYQVSVAPLYDRDGAINEVLVISQDVTARDRAERTVQRQIEMLQALYAEAYQVTENLDAGQIAVRVTQLCVESFGAQLAWLGMVEPDGVVGILACYPRESAYPHQITVRWDETPLGQGPSGCALRTGVVVVSDDIDRDPSFTPWRSDARAHGFRAGAAVPLFSPEGPLGVLNIYSDQHDFFSPERLALFQAFAHQAASAFINAQSFEAITKQREHMRALAVRLSEVEETERRTLARELHDRVGANLAALNFNINLVRAQLAANPAAPVAARLDDSRQLVSEVMSQVRDVMMGLRPAVLDDYGLLAALRWLAEDTLRRASLVATIVGVEPEPRLPDGVQTALFRIAQEALTNVLKHARATEVTIKLIAVTEMVRLTIADNGVGFDSQTVRPGLGSGLGMTTMRERAHVVGGIMRTESSPGRGSQVIVEVPR